MSKVEQGERILPPEFYTPVSKERARLALDRYMNLQFNKTGERPRASIPANPDDDDLVLSRFVEQDAASLPESQPTNSVMSRTCSGDMGKEVSQPAPEMDYQQEALSLQDAIDNIVPCTDQEVAAIADWLRAHDARVASTDRLREAITEIVHLGDGAAYADLSDVAEDMYRTAESALKESSR